MIRIYVCLLSVVTVAILTNCAVHSIATDSRDERQSITSLHNENEVNEKLKELLLVVDSLLHPNKQTIQRNKDTIDTDVPTDASAVTQRQLSLNLPGTKFGFSDTCNNKVCTMYTWALSCNVIGIDLSKDCSGYMLGYIFGCSEYPSPADIFYAPYACLLDIQTSLAPFAAIIAGGGNIASVFDTYLGNINTETCQHNCYQSWVNSTRDFYDTCTAEVNMYNKTYPIAAALPKFSNFRDQQCSTNAKDQNCFELLYNAQQNPTIDILNVQCNYAPTPTANALAGITQILSSYGCCVGNQVSMLSMNQVNVSAIKLFPPCLLRYYNMNYNTTYITPTSFCTLGAASSMAIVSQGTVTIDTTKVPSFYKSYVVGGMPNVYDTVYPDVSVKSTLSGMLFLQATIAAVLCNPSDPETALKEKSCTNITALNVEIVSYDYYNSNGDLLSSTTGVPTGSDSDYLGAIDGKGSFTFIAVIPGVDEVEAAVYSSALQAKLDKFIDEIYCAKLNCASVKFTGTPLVYASDQYITDKNAAASGYQCISLVSSILFIITTSITLLYIQ